MISTILTYANGTVREYIKYSGLNAMELDLEALDLFSVVIKLDDTIVFSAYNWSKQPK